jgi:uncharacterized NAD(P)/FAD-binding protein YdhS
MTAPGEIGGPTVAIIGLGPKGLWCLEALVEIISQLDNDVTLHIVIFNKSSEFGVSPVYDMRLPKYLLANSRVGELKLWGVNGAPAGPALDAWLGAIQPVTTLGLADYPPRALVGAYLSDGYQRLTERLPPNLAISRVSGEAIDVVPCSNAYTIRYITSSEEVQEVQVEKVLVATGHTPVMPTAADNAYTAWEHNYQHGLFVPTGADLVEALQRIRPGTHVAMKGLGLTFIDAILLLSEGRGGAFFRRSSGVLTYQPSGLEPLILPYSRTGLPMVPKPYDLPYELQQLTFVTERALRELVQRSSNGLLSIDHDVWPLVECEIKRYYYRVAATGSTESADLDACDSPAELERIIESFLSSNPQVRRFDLEAALDPIGARRFGAGREFNSFVEGYLVEMIERTYRGIGSSAHMSAFSVWFDIREVLRPFIAFGGFDPISHRTLIEARFPQLKRICLGPPTINAEKLVALMRTGIVSFAFARQPYLTLIDGCSCEVASPFEAGSTRLVDAIVDARCPPVDIENSASRLFRNMRRRGLIRPFVNAFPTGASAYRTGAIDVTAEYHHVIDAAGRANPDIAVIGIPTEGNLVGNFSIVRDRFARVWAGDVVRQLGIRDR